MLTAIAVSFLAQVCDIPDVIDVATAERFGESVLVITIPTGVEHERVSSQIPPEHQYSLHITPLFGLGSFTGDSAETQYALSLVTVSPYNVHGTEQNKTLEAQLKDVEAREAEAWAALPVQDRRAEIKAEIERRRAAGRREFGSCWLGKEQNSPE